MFILAPDRIGWNNLGVTSQGERFRKHRKMLQQNLSLQAIAPFLEYQAHQLKTFLGGLLAEPEEFLHHTER